MSQDIPSFRASRYSYFQIPFDDFQLDLSRFRHDLSWPLERFNKAPSIAHISLVGVDWGDQLIERSTRIRSHWGLDLTKYYAGTIPYMLTKFPGLRQLDVGAAMLREFADYASEVGQRWQPVMNILRRNQGSLKAVLSDEMKDAQGAWLYQEVWAETSITILARGRMPLREAMWTLEEISAAVQLKLNQADPSPSMTVSCRGKKHIVRLFGISQRSAEIQENKAYRKRQADNLRRAQQYDRFPPAGTEEFLTDCPCPYCKAQKKGEWGEGVIDQGV